MRRGIMASDAGHYFQLRDSCSECWRLASIDLYATIRSGMGDLTFQAEDVTARDVVAQSSRAPRPPLVFRVGVVGHRPDRLKAAELDGLKQALGLVLSSVARAVGEFHGAHLRLFGDAPPELRAISPLAEGTDRMFAEEALDREYSLCCPMPFFQEEYEKDFAPGPALEERSLERFRGILRSAREQGRLTTFELDGDREQETTAYSAVGRVVVNQSDLLVVVWDGVRLDRGGGTEEKFDEALVLGKPVVWIDAHRPHTFQVIERAAPIPRLPAGQRARPREGASLEDLKALVRDSLALPENAGGPTEGREITLDDFCKETKPILNFGVPWRLFRDAIGDFTLRRPRLFVPDFEAAAEGEWPRGDSTGPGRMIDRLRPYYAWTDGPAVWYSDAYRSVSVLSFVLAALAVILALVPIAAGWTGAAHAHLEIAFVSAELLAIVLVLALVFFCRERRWHDKWIDYRLTSELLRHVRLVGPLAGARSVPPAHAHLASYRHPGATWAAWYARAVERSLELPTARVDTPYLRAAAADLRSIIGGQRDYHEATAARAHRIEKRLHWLGMGLFGATLLCCVVHLLPHASAWFGHVHLSPEFMGSLCAILPALGAACAGINNFGEFRRVGKQSEAMVRRLDTLHERSKVLEKAVGGPPPAKDESPLSAQLADLATEASQVMVNEVLGWRIVFLDRPPVLPT